MWFSLIRRELSSPVLRNTFNRSTFQQHSPNTSFSFNHWNYLVFNEPMKMKIESWILHIRTILCQGGIILLMIFSCDVSGSVSGVGGEVVWLPCAGEEIVVGTRMRCWAREVAPATVVSLSTDTLRSCPTMTVQSTLYTDQLYKWLFKMLSRCHMSWHLFLTIFTPDGW